MEKRLFIAILVSIAFLWGWGMLAPRLFPELAKKSPPQTDRPVVADRQVEATREASTITASAAEQPSEPVPADRRSDEASEADRGGRSVDPIQAAIEQPVTVENSYVRATFTNRGAQLRSLRLKQYDEIERDEPVELVRSRAEGEPYPLALRSADDSFNRFASESLYTVERTREGDATVLHFRTRDESGREITKRFIFGDEEAFGYQIRTMGIAEPYNVVIGPGIGLVGAERDDRFEMSGNLVVEADGDYKMVKRKKIDSVMTIDNPTFVGLADHYFLTVLIPEKGGAATVQPVELPKVEEDGQPLRELYVGVNAVDGEVSGRAYFGPKKAEVLESYGLGETLELGIFGVIARFLLRGLIWINSITHNFGWAIVFLTVIIKLVLYPLQHKSIVSMKRMQKVQPKMNAIRDKYRKAKTDPQQKQKMNVEMMELYKREGINPMSGCLPILLQLPILWAFYILLSHAIELRGEPFILWITDLSAKDPYYITPILMTVTMFIQQWITPTAADPMQRKIFLAMPIIFGWIFKEFPSGLVLYWLVQNLLTILQQSLMNRWWKEHPEALERGAAT